MLNSIRRSLSTNQSLKRSFTSQKRGEQREKLHLEIGTTNNNFELLSKDFFSDFDFTLYKFKHSSLGTIHYHIDSSDTNNCFAINFTTLPEDSTGKMHILEHIALCGSEKYPVRDPFMSMIKRSLNTYMNACTGPDFTCYPFSTVNRKDFYNLLSVYGESVFRPLLKKTDFMQEGWRLEFSDPADKTSGLQIKGVVYNEMKGVYENPDSLFMENVQELLLQDTPYRHDSGGKPEDIPNLLHEDLVRYHKNNYHPSNATIFTYGDLSVTEHQDFLETNFLKHFQRAEFKTPELRGKLQEPIRKTITMPPSAVELKPGQDTWFGVGFLCGGIDSDPKEIVGLDLLGTLLFDSPTSPFYSEFLETGLADGFTPACGFEHNLFDTYFTIGFKNIKNGSEGEIEKKIFETLEQIAEEGLDPEMVSSTIHQIEISAKIAKQNFGIQLVMGNLGSLNHRIDALIKQGLDINKVLDYIRENTKEGKTFLQDLVRKYFLQNPKRLHLTMVTDPAYLEKVNQRERELVARLERGLTEETANKIVEEALQLKLEQEKPQDNDLLPTLTVKDIPREVEPTLVHQEKIGGIETYFFNKPTNGVVHFRMKIDLKSIDHSSVHSLFVLSSIFDKIGTAECPYDEFYNKIRQDTTGIEMGIYYDGATLDKDKINGFAVISASCLERNVHKMFQHLSDLITTPDFKDYQNMLNLVRIESAAAVNRIVERPLDFAMDYGVGSQSRAQQFYGKLANVEFIYAESLLVQLWSESSERRYFTNLAGRPRDEPQLHNEEDVQEEQYRIFHPRLRKRPKQLPGSRLELRGRPEAHLLS